MNYDKNKIEWKLGDIIIHDADAKRKNLLMKIIEKKLDINDEIRFVCAYIDKKYHMDQKGFTEKEFHKWNRWENSINPLHDPKRFGL